MKRGIEGALHWLSCQFFVTYADVSPLPGKLELRPLTSRSENKQNIVNTRIKLAISDWNTGQNCNKLESSYKRAEKSVQTIYI